MKKITIARIFLNTFLAVLFFASAVAVPTYSIAQAVTCTGTSTTDGSPIPAGCTPPTTTGGANVITLTLQNPLTGVNTLPDFITKVMTGIVELLTPVIVIMFLWTGFLFVKAQGKAEELVAAKKSLMYTIIGAALVLGAKGLSLVLQATYTNL